MAYTADDIAYLWLADAKISTKVVQSLLDIYQSPGALFEHFAEAKALYLSPKQSELLTQSKLSLNRKLDLLEQSDIHYVNVDNDAFPEKLKYFSDAPYAIFYRGNLNKLNQKCAAVIGTRKPSYYGKKITKEIAQNIGDLGVCVVSGLAMGIDTYAHQASYASKGGTCAVGGCGINFNYPANNKRLKEDIIANDGLILSEYTMDTPPLAFHFPFRNRIIAALSDVVVFVEGSIKSGGMHTVSKAMELNKIVYAVPGNIDNELSQGPNQLLAFGEAKFYYQFQDIMKDLDVRDRVFIPSTDIKKLKESDLSGIQLEAYQLLKLAPRSFDELVDLMKRPPDEVQLAVGYLELLDYIIRVGGNTYQVQS